MMAKHSRGDPGSGSGVRYPGTFLIAVRQALVRLNWQVERFLPRSVVCRDPTGKEQLVGLENLYRRARRADRAEWVELIAGFLGSVDLQQLQGDPKNLGEVTDRLMVRIGQPLRAPNAEGALWCQPLGDTGLQLNLVIDYPQSMVYVSEKMIEESGQPGETWLAPALANLKEKTPSGCLDTIDADSGLKLCAVGDAYDASRALLLETLLPEFVERGYFVALPSRDELLVLPVTKEAILNVGWMKVLADRNYKSAPYSISDEVYWVRGGGWLRFPMELREQRLSITPPPEFLGILDELMGDAREEGDEGNDPPAEETST
jgi:hypothetical protein